MWCADMPVSVIRQHGLDASVPSAPRKLKGAEAPPTHDVPSELARRRGGAVLTAGDPAPPGAQSLMLNVQQFVADPTGEVTLEADLSLHSGKTTSAIRHVRIQTASEGPGGNAIASDMSRTLAQLADRISSEL